MSITKVSDVCNPCLTHGMRLSVEDVVLDKWRSLLDEISPSACVETPAASDESAKSPAVLRAHDRDLSGGQPAEKRNALVDKQRVQQRLCDYRQKHGLGCFDAVARAARNKEVTSTTLRDIVIGQAVIPASVWRAVDRALDKVEQSAAVGAKEGANG